MTWISEDPTYLAGLLGLLAASCFMAMRVTQQGKYVFWAFGGIGFAAAVLVIEHFWITDNERLEAVVYELRQAVLKSDVEGVLAQLTPDVEYVQNGTVVTGETTRELVRASLARYVFDFIHISELQTSAGKQTRRGKAEFRVYAKGTVQSSMATVSMGTANSTWSLGFEETAPGVWKVNRITPMSLPNGAISAPRFGGRGRGAMKRPGFESFERGERDEIRPRRKGQPRGVRFRDEPPKADRDPGRGEANHDLR